MNFDQFAEQSAPSFVAEIDEVAVHRGLRFEEAVEAVYDMLEQPWGHAAMRQMVWDNLRDAETTEQEERAAKLRALYQQVCRRYTGHHDRRAESGRDTAPVWH